MQTGVLFLILSGSGGATQVSTSKVYQQCWKEWASWCAQQHVPNNPISAPKLDNFLVHLFQVGLAWHTIGVYHSSLSSLTTFKLTWKTATLSAFVTEKHCSDLTFLCIDYQHLFRSFICNTKRPSVKQSIKQQVVQILSFRVKFPPPFQTVSDG